MDEAKQEAEALPERERGRQGLSTGAKVGVVLLVLGGAVSFLLFGSETSDAFVYSKLVNEVAVAPGQFMGKELRVEGELKPGSIKFREDPCEWRFVIEKDGSELPIRYPQCVVPDTFRDGMGISVTVQGKLAEGGDGFVANQVIPKCPSKYEMKEKLKSGEQMPHAVAPPGLEDS